MKVIYILFVSSLILFSVAASGDKIEIPRQFHGLWDIDNCVIVTDSILLITKSQIGGYEGRHEVLKVLVISEDNVKIDYRYHGMDDFTFLDSMNMHLIDGNIVTYHPETGDPWIKNRCGELHN